MSKRRGSFQVHALLLGLAVLVVIAGFARWSSTGGGIGKRKTQIAFWNGFTGPDGVVMLKIIEEFNQANPDTEVVMQRIPWGTYYNKLTVAGSDGRGPQVFVVHADALARIRRAGFIGDVSTVFTGPGAIDPSDFDDLVINYVNFNGKFEGLPLDIHPQGLFLNKAMLRQAGFVDASGEPVAPKTGKEFEQLMTKLTIEPNASLKEKQWGFALTFWGANLRTLIPQFGGRFLNEAGEPEMNSAQNIAALDYLANLAKDKKVPPPDNGLGWFGYRTKRVGMVWDGIFMLGDLIRLNDLEYMGAPIPQIGEKPGTVANSHVVCINRSVSAEERVAVEKFMRHLSDRNVAWAAAGQVPARKSARLDPEFKKLQVQAAFAEQVPTMVYPPRIPTIFEYMQELDRAAERAVRGQVTPKVALDEAQQNILNVMARDRREHPEAS